MGFEQLASLKTKLAQQAATEKAKQKTNASPKTQADPLLLAIRLLQKHFPLAFPKKPLPKVPLKIGIHKDLLEQAEQLGLNKSDIRAALKKWCKGKRYSECLIAGSIRVDLQGQEAGFVSKEEATQAEQKHAAPKTAESFAETVVATNHNNPAPV